MKRVQFFALPLVALTRPASRAVSSSVRSTSRCPRTRVASSRAAVSSSSPVSHLPRTLLSLEATHSRLPSHSLVQLVHRHGGDHFVLRSAPDRRAAARLCHAAPVCRHLRPHARRHPVQVHHHLHLRLGAVLHGRTRLLGGSVLPVLGTPTPAEHAKRSD